MNNPFSYGDEYADLLTGNLNSYNEANFNRLNNISYNTIEGFAQDSWKATRKLTLEFGLRFTHFSPWIDREGFGYSIFDQSQYNPNCAATPTFCGFAWNAKDSSVPLGGFPTRTFFYQPRIGAAYDVFGTGNTVLRGGWGRFYYHSGQFTSGLDASAGAAQANLGPTTWTGGPGSRPIRQTDHACLRSISLALTSPLRRLLPRLSILKMISNLSPTAGALPSHRGCRGKACSKLLTWETGVGIWRIPAGQVATSTWFLSGPCSVLLTRQMPIRSFSAP